MDVNVLNAHLMNGEVTVHFEKNDGSVRTMRCTKNFSKIPPEKHPAQRDSVEYTDLIKVFDLDEVAWRSFKPSRVLSYE